jgi:hypothetical protein
VTVSSVVATGTANRGILWNNAGQVSTNALFEYQASTQTMYLGGTSSNILLNEVIGNAASTAASTMAIYARTVANRFLVKVQDPTGLEYALQPHMGNNSVAVIYPTSSNVGALNSGFMSIGTFSSGASVVGTAYNVMRKSVFRASTAAANLTAGVMDPDNRYFLSSTAGIGGFYFHCRFALDTYASSTRYFVGMTATASSTICTSNPTGMINSIGFGFNDNGTGFVFMHSSSGAATTEALLGQPALATGNAYDAYIYAKPNDSRVYYRMDDFPNSSTLVNSSVAVHLPNSTTFMKPVAMCGQLNASSGACRIGFVRMYVETDF